MVKILLTGASGFLGQHLLQHLRSTSHDVTALCHRQESAERLRAHYPSYRVACVDLASPDSIDAFLAFLAGLTFDVCIHSAAISSPKLCEQDPERARAVNVPQYFLEKLGSGTYTIVLSTDQVYEGTGPPYKEDDPVNPLNAYGQSKVTLEQLCSHRPTIQLRSSILLGPTTETPSHDTFLHFVASRKDTPTEFYTDEKRSVVGVHDVVRMILWLVEHPGTSGVYNMGGTASISRADMARAVGDYLGWEPSSYLIPCVKPQSSGVPTPLDISMDSTKLYDLTGIVPNGLADVVKETFATKEST